MKDKIKEIAVLAKIQMVSEPRLEDFADRLIRECILAVEEVKTQPVTTYERDMTDTRTVNKCIQAIKDKFQ